MLNSPNLKEALQSKSLTRLTKAISASADGLAYQLKPPYTEILEFKAKEGDGRVHVHFAAILHLHYASLQRRGEGLVFTIKFGGEALSDLPSPPIDELFYAAAVQSLHISGYGARRTGESTNVSKEMAENLELPSTRLRSLTLEDFRKMVDRET
jgi:hypothetical protein